MDIVIRLDEIADFGVTDGSILNERFPDEGLPVLNDKRQRYCANRAINAYGTLPVWLAEHIKNGDYGRKAFLAAVAVMNACCHTDAGPLTGYFHPSKGAGRTFKVRKGALPAADIILIAQSLITHGVIGKAKVRRPQRHEGGDTISEFVAVDYIVAAQIHFGMSEQEAGNLTMTKFQLLLNAKYPDQKGFTKEEYEAVADDYFARKARRMAKGK